MRNRYLHDNERNAYHVKETLPAVREDYSGCPVGHERPQLRRRLMDGAILSRGGVTNSAFVGYNFRAAM